MSKFTPGPWTVDSVMSENLHDITLGYEIPGEGSPILIASVYGDKDEVPDVVHGEANARLIAASPDLLALALAYEEWEADLIMHADWSSGTIHMTQAQHDRMLEIQAMRNAAKYKAGCRS